MTETLTLTKEFQPIEVAASYYSRDGGANRRRLMPPHRSGERLLLTPALYRLIERVNAEINDPASRSPLKITYANDQDVHGVADHWANPHQLSGTYIDPATGRRVPRKGRGDCEDIAIATRDEIIRRAKRELGIDINPGALLLTMVDTAHRNYLDHAVLTLRGRSPEGEDMDLILGDQKKEILHWYQTGYNFTAMETPEDPAKFREVQGYVDQTMKLPNMFARTIVRQRDSGDTDTSNVHSYGYVDPTTLRSRPLAQTSGNTVMAFTQPMRMLAERGMSGSNFIYSIYKDNPAFREVADFNSNEQLFSVQRLTKGERTAEGTGVDRYQLLYTDASGIQQAFHVAVMATDSGSVVMEPTDAAERAEQLQHLTNFRDAMSRAGIMWKGAKGAEVPIRQIPTPEDLRDAGRAIIKASAAIDRSQERGTGGPDAPRAPGYVAPPEPTVREQHR